MTSGTGLIFIALTSLRALARDFLIKKEI